MSDSQHYNKADELMQQEHANTGGQYLDPQTTALKTAAIEATLALAYEQRTANLIAIYTDGNTGTAPGVNYVEVLAAITERLGLA
jgi:hypothetical protein